MRSESTSTLDKSNYYFKNIDCYGYRGKMFVEQHKNSVAAIRICDAIHDVICRVVFEVLLGLAFILFRKKD